jgi:sulfur carrier protein
MTRPVSIEFNGQPRPVSPGTTVAQLLDELHIPSSRVAVEINLQLVPRTAHGEHVLREGDRVEVVSLAGGG